FWLNPLHGSRVHFRSRFHLVSFTRGGGSWTCKTSNTCHFFRDDEQAPKRIPVRDKGEASRADRSRQQGTDREAGQERPLPMRFGHTVQELLPEKRLLLMA